MAHEPKVTLEFTEGDLAFLLWSMEFLQGGPHDFEQERQYWEVMFRKALDDHFPEEPPAPAKRIVVEFVGGFKDGQRLANDASDQQEAEQAHAYYHISESGTVGKRFRTLSDAGLMELQEIAEETPDGPRLKREPTAKMNHIYQVVARNEDDRQITVRFQYMGREGSGGTS